jgi:hypothetical protein
MSEPGPEKFKSLGGPIDIVKAGIKAVPAVKWALGVAGVGAALAIVSSFFSDATTAFVGIGVMIFFMTLLVIFAAAASLKGNAIRGPAYLLTWAMIVLFVGSATLFASSVFFDWPKPIRDLLGVGRPSHKPNAAAGKSSSARETPPSDHEARDPRQASVSTGEAMTGKAGPPDTPVPDPPSRRAPKPPQAAVKPDTFRLCNGESRVLLDGEVTVRLSFLTVDRDKVGTATVEVPGRGIEKLDLMSSLDFDYGGRHNRVVIIASDPAEACATFQLVSRPRTESGASRKVSP